jgi:acetylornithine deacetylase/succinyl-diaminopimelate desuccinylase-like protein
VFRFTISTDGVAGHASLPGMGDNALVKMAPLLERLATRQPSYRLTGEPREFLLGIGEQPDDLAGSVARLRSADPRLATMFEPMFGVTFTPTIISASEKVNVIPSRAALKVDCRAPAGLGEAEVLDGIAEVLGPANGEWSIEFDERVVGNASPIRSPLMDSLAAWIAERDPGAGVVPVVLPGFTDSRHFRMAFPECVAYGFFPHRHQSLLEAAPLVHGADERVDVRDLTFASELFRDIAQQLLGAA